MNVNLSFDITDAQRQKIAIGTDLGRMPNIEEISEFVMRAFAEAVGAVKLPDETLGATEPAADDLITSGDRPEGSAETVEPQAS